MTNIKSLIITPFFLTLFMIIAAAAGDLQKATLRVDGLACPFCAYGVEKKLQKIEGVEKLDIKINDGLVVIYFQENAKIDKKLITQKVKEAGFTLRDISIETPQSEIKKGEKITLQIEGMTCQGCVDRIKTALSKVECIQEANVNLEKKEAKVICTGGGQDRQKVVDAVNNLGFKAEIVNKK